MITETSREVEWGGGGEGVPECSQAFLMRLHWEGKGQEDHKYSAGMKRWCLRHHRRIEGSGGI